MIMENFKSTNLFDKVMFSTIDLPSHEKLALLYVIRYWELKSMKKVTNTPLSKFKKLMGLCNPTMIRVMSHLEEMGLITKRQNAFKMCNDYIPNIEAIMNLKTYNPITMKEEEN